MITVRQRLVDLVAARIDGIAEFVSVRIWQATPVAESDLPAAIVRDGKCESRISATNVHEHRLLFEVDILADDVQQLRSLIGEVLAAIRLDLFWSDGTQKLAFRTEPIDDMLVTRQEERFVAGARVQFAISFRTALFDPTLVYP